MGVAAPPLVGRETERAVLERALEAVDGGRAQAVGLTGEPGIGKTRLLTELAREAAALGHLVVAARATELEREVPFALWVDAFDGRDDALAPDVLAGLTEDELADLAVALPAVRARLTGAPAATVERHRVARAVRALLERLAATRPVCVLLDDVHWADPASADVIAVLLHRPPRRAVLLALASRPGRAPAVEEALHAAALHGEAELVEVGPLGPAAAVALLPASVGPLGRARLLRESGGNPFYLQALAGPGARAGTPPAALAGPGTPGVPRPVLAALAGEVGRLAPAARQLVQGAAVAGDPFELTVASAAAELGDAAALEALDELCAADLARPTADPRRFRFRHPLVRRAVYEGTGGGWRLAAHTRAAAALAARGATPAQRAHHVERAAHPGDLDAVELLVRAAEEVAGPAPATASAWYAAALRLLPEGPAEAERRVALQRARAAALLAAGRAADARDALCDTLELLGPGTAAERAEVAEGLGMLELWMGRPEEARRVLGAARERLGAVSPVQRAALTLALGRERAACGDHEAAERLAGEARAAARAAGDAVVEADAAAQVADSANLTLRGTDPAALARADRLLAEAAALVEALPDERLGRRPEPLLWLVFARVATGRLTEARRGAEHGLALTRAAGHGFGAPLFVVMRGFACEELGRLDEAQEAAEETLESALVSGNAHVENWGRLLSAWVAVARGDVHAALGHAEAGRAFGDAFPPSSAGWTLAEARLAAGDVAGALEALEAFGLVDRGLWARERLRALDVLVRALVAAGREEEAATWAASAAAEAGGRDGLLAAIAGRARATAALARGDAAGAARAALAGAEAAERAPAPLWAARCRTTAAEALVAARREGEARALLRDAAAELERRGAWGDRDAALRVLRRLGERPRPAAAAGGTAARDGDGRLGALSPREREVAALVAEGCTNGQIAARLHLSERTVEKHVSSALAKLGLASRSGIAALLVHA